MIVTSAGQTTDPPSARTTAHHAMHVETEAATTKAYTTRGPTARDYAPEQAQRVVERLWEARAANGNNARMATSELAALGRAIHKRRDSLNLTRRELAERANVSVSQIARIEHGQANATLNTLQKIANGIDLSFGGMIVLVENEINSSTS